MTLPLEELEVYQLAEKIADLTWDECATWKWFARDTVGKQLVRAADSIGSNIAEGYGRYAFRENIQFCYYARGSLMETRHLLTRAHKRGLLEEEIHGELQRLHDTLCPKLNAYINAIRRQLHDSPSTRSNDK